MTGLIDCTKGYLPDRKEFPDVFITTDTLSDANNWPSGVKRLFVLNPPQLDIPVLDEILKEGRQLFLVHIQDEVPGNLHPLRQFWKMDSQGLKAELDLIADLKAPVIDMSCESRPWWKKWLKLFILRNEKDRVIVDSKNFVYFFKACIPYNDSFELDDVYRCITYGKIDPMQSARKFLHILAGLHYVRTRIPNIEAAFRGTFKFYNDPPTSDKPFDCDGGELASLRRQITEQVAQEDTVEYAMAIACLSEIGEAFTHHGRNDLHLKLAGGLVYIDDGHVKIDAFDKERRAILREQDPVLYIHLFYRAANKYLIARFDEMKEIDSLIKAAENLYKALSAEQGLNFTKRKHEFVALSGTLCQFQTFNARFKHERRFLTDAKNYGEQALANADPIEADRDMNYWIAAVLTDWVLFPGEDEAFAENHALIADYIDKNLEAQPDNPFNIMIALQTAAAEARCYADYTQIRKLLKKYKILERLYRTDYDINNVGQYPLGLAAGYAALIVPSSGSEVPGLFDAMEKAFNFFKAHTEKSLILKLVALKFGACFVFYLNNHGKYDYASKCAKNYIDILKALPDGLNLPAAVKTFFKNAVANPKQADGKAAFKVVFRLPY